MLPEFDFLRPTTLTEALAMLAEHGPDAVPVAGGTNVIVDLRHRKHQPKALVDMGRVAELRGIRRDDGHIVVGAGTTISELLTHPLIAEHASILHDAARVFANPLIRNRATVGGNLADASPAADTAPPLLALGAEVALASQAGTRWLALADFLVGVRKTLRRPDELLTAVRWSPPPAPQSWGERPSPQSWGARGAQASSPQSLRVRGAYTKIGLRKADAISVLSAAVVVTQDGAGRCQRVAIALGAVAPRPFRATEAEILLTGQPLTAEAIAEAARLAAAAIRPISDIRGEADYRRRVTEVIVRRLLAQAAMPRRTAIETAG
ncbi:MAG: xanthine dehydrogenase family protein subunit M [Chloroflexi bacterium]|nr:xanthine dehydrogenase family protein subunit M [Chloroflexota bacterium]